MRSLGLSVTPDEMEELTESLGACPPHPTGSHATGSHATGGPLDASEMAAALRRLQEAATHADADALQQAKTCALLRKSYRMLHGALQRALAEDEANDETAARGETPSGAATPPSGEVLAVAEQAHLPPAWLGGTAPAAAPAAATPRSETKAIKTTKKAPTARRIF